MSTTRPAKRMWLLCLLLLLSPAARGELSQPSIQIRTDFEGASLGSWEQIETDTFRLTIREDNAAPQFRRWYSFKVRGAAGRELTFHFTNAGQSSAAGAWSFNRPVVSADGGQTWSRIENTAYEDGVFTFTCTMESNDQWIALNPVYNFSRWLELIERVAPHPTTQVRVLTESLDGHPVHLLTITDPAVDEAEKSAVWIIARQHPAETPGSWMTEGLIEWLLGADDQAAELRRRSVFLIIGFMNPDGVLRGNFRSNSVGRNLNREWENLDPATAPTVAAAAEAMLQYQAGGGRIVLFADLHAHSSIRRNFFFWNSAEATSPEMAAEMEQFMRTFERINPDFTAEGSHPSGISNSRIAKAWAYTALSTHAVTFEAAYQDVEYGPYAGEYLTVERLLNLGAGLGQAIAEHFYGIARR